MTAGLQELDHSKETFKDVSIPIELLQTVDGGKNPQLYTRQCMESTLAKNKEINGKVELYKKFRATLMKELSEDFPKQMEQYRLARTEKADSGWRCGSAVDFISSVLNEFVF